MAVAAGRRGVVDVLLFIASAALLVAVIVLSLVPRLPPGGFSLQDKVDHVVAYGALCGCTLLAGVWRPGRGAGPWARSARWVALATLGVGVALELVQAFGPFEGRTGDPTDVLADAIGIALSVAARHRLRART